jgi:hypothetical protein
MYLRVDGERVREVMQLRAYMQCGRERTRALAIGRCPGRQAPDHSPSMKPALHLFTPGAPPFLLDGPPFPWVTVCARIAWPAAAYSSHFSIPPHVRYPCPPKTTSAHPRRPVCICMVLAPIHTGYEWLPQSVRARAGSLHDRFLVYGSTKLSWLCWNLCACRCYETRVPENTVGFGDITRSFPARGALVRKTRLSTPPARMLGAVTRRQSCARLRAR